jgi:hypothetical protein
LSGRRSGTGAGGSGAGGGRLPNSRSNNPTVRP